MTNRQKIISWFAKIFFDTIDTLINNADQNTVTFQQVPEPRQHITSFQEYIITFIKFENKNESGDSVNKYSVNTILKLPQTISANKQQYIQFTDTNPVTGTKQQVASALAILTYDLFTSPSNSLQALNTNTTTYVANVGSYTQTSPISTTQTITTTTPTYPWVTSGTTLQNSNGNYYVFKGFSLTSLEYAASVFATTSFYDFGYYTLTNDVYYTHYQNGTSTTSTGNNGNSGLTLNAYYLMQNIFLQLTQSGKGTETSPYSAPLLRIPVNADYWLNGTAQNPAVNSYSSPYFTNGQTNVSFTATEYQQAIIDLIYYCYTTWTTTTTKSNIPISFVIDLHWNYASQVPLTSGSYPSTSVGSPNYSYSTASSKQLPMPGVAVYDTTNLNLTDNTIEFWTSVASLFGVNSDGSAIGSPSAYTYTNGSSTTYFTKSPTTTSLPVGLLQNIFFELYNEPFTDQLTYSNGGTPYSNNYSAYVNGGTYTWNSSSYNFTGFGQMYNTIRQTIGAQNICIIAGAENYAFMNFNTTSGNGQWGTSTNTINTNTYNCFTILQDAITNGTIYLDSANPTGGNFSATDFTNVLINLHPYVGLYSGATKHPGYYDPSYSTPIAGFGQIITALQTPGTTFSMSCPIICTEYGQYDLPWSTYSTTPSTEASSYTYSSDYFSDSNTVQLIESQGSTYGTPYYNGNYVDSSGAITSVPGIIGFLTDFINNNVSFCAWAIRPNSGGNGEIQSSLTANSWLVADSNPYYYSWNPDTNAWDAIQPDVICGSANALLNFTSSNGETATNPPTNPATPLSSMPNSELYFELISSSNQDLSDNTINYGANGADFSYILMNYYNT